MSSGDVALRLSSVFVVAGSIALAAGIYEIDRREKSSSETVAANLKNVEQRIEVLANQMRVLNSQSSASNLQIQALGNQVQVLESRLKELDDHTFSVASR